MERFEIYYEDLESRAQKELCKIFGTSPEKENWDTISLATIEREDEREEGE